MHQRLQRWQEMYRLSDIRYWLGHWPIWRLFSHQNKLSQEALSLKALTIGAQGQLSLRGYKLTPKNKSRTRASWIKIGKHHDSKLNVLSKLSNGRSKTRGHRFINLVVSIAFSKERGLKLGLISLQKDQKISRRNTSIEHNEYWWKTR